MDPPRIALDRNRRSEGAHQILGEVRGPLHWDRATLPEILVSSIEFGAAEGHDGIRAGLGPVHAGAFQASADGDLAARFDDTGGRAELLRVKLRIAYPVSVV